MLEFRISPFTSKLRHKTFFIFSEEYVPGAARKGMEWQYFFGDCSDPAVQEKAKENFIIGFNEVFAPNDPNYCQREKICELDNIRITCGATQRRKRRNAQVSLKIESEIHKAIGNVTAQCLNSLRCARSPNNALYFGFRGSGFDPQHCPRVVVLIADYTENLKLRFWQ